MAKEVSRPILITIVAILWFISGLICLAAGILLLIGGSISLADLGFEELENLGTTGVGIIYTVLGIINLIIAGGIWNGWKVMWYIGVLYSIIQIILAIASIILTSGFGMIITIIIHALILYYLFRPRVKEFFGF
jgi:hypothetical protein